MIAEQAFDWRSILHRSTQRQRALMALQSPLASTRQVSGALAVGAGAAGTTTIVNCKFDVLVDTILTSYPWTGVNEVRPGSEQWVNQVGDMTAYVATPWGATPNAASTVFGFNPAIATLQCGIANCIISTTIKRLINPTTNTQPLISRWTDSNNYWRIGMKSNGNLLAIEEVNGGITTLRASAPKVFADGAEYPLQVILDGNTITATFLDDSTSITYNFATHNNTSTIHGIYSRSVFYSDILDFMVDTL